jgi:DNA-binding CsgD family transcriptional regulator
MVTAVMGFIELSLGNLAEAHTHLGDVTRTMAAIEAWEPGNIRYLANEIEALVGLGETVEADRLLGDLEERGRNLDRPWALATSARCRGLLSAARGALEPALASLDKALVEHERLQMPFELGRTALVRGVIERRAKHKRAAKDSLEQALGIFVELGAPLWAEKARRELGRVGLRPPAPLGLTPTEERVAELVAAGHTNREVADALFMSPKTVDANLSRIYRKLGVRSRTELARRFPGDHATAGES